MRCYNKMSRMIFASIFIAVFIVAEMSYAQQMVLKFGHASPPTISIGGYQTNVPYQMGAEKLKEIVEARSRGSIKIDIYPAAQLGAERELLEALKLGSVDIVVSASAPLSAWEPKMMVTDLPFIFKDVETARRLLEGAIGQEIMGFLEKSDIKGLSIADNTFRQMITSKKPIRTPEDIKGLKFRVIESPLFVKMFEVLGVGAVPLAYTEVYTSLQTGTVDGYDQPIVYHLSGRMFEVTKYVSFTNHILQTTPYLMSMKTWKKLSPEMQKVFLEAGQAARKVHNEHTDKINNVAIENLKRAGTIFVTDVNVSAFKEKMGPVYERFEKEIGKDLIERIKNFK